MPAMKNAGSFFLVGLPGAGKSTLGRALARHLGFTFVDADQFLVERTGVGIPTIFALEGETGFRVREKAVIDELTQRQGIVLATGGGAVLNEDNRTVLRERGRVVYLFATPDELYHRLRYDKGRPLLQVENPLAKLQELYDERDPLYRQIADDIVDINGRSCTQAIDIFLKELNK
ncbi:MAG: shikimate kinase [Neisseriaceae bacterium]|nr:shikimate kinase [Neisseriaceae bacterium]